MTLQLLNTFRSSLDERPQIGLGIMYPAPGIIERIGSDWDWVWTDGQHGNLDYRNIMAAVRACSLIRKPAVVRVPGHDAGVIGKALDTAAEGVMVPMINDAGQAVEAAKASKFATLGARSYGGRRPIDFDGRGYANRESVQPLLICQIETSAGLRNADEIAGVEGVDALFFGPDDMTLEAGLPMNQKSPNGYFNDAVRAIADAAKSHDKIAGGVFTSPESIMEAAEYGYRLIISTADVVLLAAGSKEKAQAMRQSLSGK